MIVFFHGGGFIGGDKKSVPGWLVNRCLEQGISVVSANYRLSKQSPFPAPMLDGARAIQFLRLKSADLGIDPRRIAACGNSAGAGIALWVGFHDDLGDSGNVNPVLRQSTRLSCIGVVGGADLVRPKVHQATDRRPRRRARRAQAALWRDFAGRSRLSARPQALRGGFAAELCLLRRSAGHTLLFRAQRTAFPDGPPGPGYSPSPLRRLRSRPCSIRWVSNVSSATTTIIAARVIPSSPCIAISSASSLAISCRSKPAQPLPPLDLPGWRPADLVETPGQLPAQ